MRLRLFVGMGMLVLGSWMTGCGNGADTASSTANAPGMCAEHGVAEARCPFCHPDLVETMGMCGGHGVPEALCWQCSGSILPGFQAVGDWCAEHDRPESQCYLCNPGLDPKHRAGVEPAAAGEPGDGIRGNASPVAIDDLPRSLRPPAVFCSTSESIVRFENAGVPAAAGLEYAVSERRAVTSTLVLNAVITYPADRFARLASPVPGVVAEVRRDLGQRVEAGDVLAVVASPALGAAKATYRQALAAERLHAKNHEREAALLERGVATQKEALQAETDLAEARIAVTAGEQELLALGLTSDQVAATARGEGAGTLQSVIAPFGGVIVERDAMAGEVVDTAHPLFALADVSVMWAILDVYETDAREIAVGQAVVVHTDALPGEAFGGTVTWVSSAVDPHTRTLRVRAELHNPEGRLRANMFAEAAVSVRAQTQAVVVPKAAVQWEGCCNVVFVKQSDTVFEPRKVRLGIATGTLYEVLTGVNPGETVVTAGSFLLKTELLKGSIGAGCCELRPGS